MNILQKRLHLLTLLIEEKSDLLAVGMAVAHAARMSHLRAGEGQRVGAVITDLAAAHLQHLKRCRMRYFLGCNPDGNPGFEMVLETSAGSGVPVCGLEKMQLLEQVMDQVEVEEQSGKMEIRAVKWGSPGKPSEKLKSAGEFPEEVFREDKKYCLENLREKHEELLRQLEERSRQNEELYRLNSELYHLNRDMETAAAERAINEMALRIAHEIRNPATVIGGLVKVLLKEGAIAEKCRSKAETILAKTKELEQIVRKFEELAGQRAYFKRNEDLGVIMRESADILQSEFHHKGVELRLEVPPGTFSFKANVGMLKIALTHLLRNALEASQAGGLVEFNLSGKPGRYVIRIRDAGTGIPPDKMEHILEPFVTTKPSRAGLGLPIVKQIVEEHRGSISLQSKLGQGTTVILEFPVIYIPT